MYHFDLINSPKLKVSSHGNFHVIQLCESVVICEAKGGDRFSWGNATETEPAFIVYLGCKKEEVAEKIRYINNVLDCYWCEVRQPKYLKGFEAEIKIRGMQRWSDEEQNGLDYLLFDLNTGGIQTIDSDEYDYYATGYMPRW